MIIRDRGLSWTRISFCTGACLWFILVIAIPRDLHANNKGKPCGLISGTVWGPDDRALPGVKVNIRSVEDRKAHWKVRSNYRGEFWQYVPKCGADYLVSADTKGYKSPEGKRLQPGAQVTVHVETKEHAQTGLHLKY